MNGQKTTIDGLRFRTLSDHFSVLEALRPSFGTVADLLEYGPTEKGKDGWESRRPIILAGDIALGAVDYGGESQRGWLRVILHGSSCEWVQDWGSFSGLVNVLNDPQLTRVDIAFTTGNPAIVNHDKVIQAHASGLFSSGGRPPKSKVITGSEPTDGRTVYVGSRDSHKFVRCYEKGWEMLAKHGLPEDFKKGSPVVQLDGFGMVPAGDLYRVEVEFKAVDKVLSWPMLVDRDAYFAGANPFCASLLPGAPVRRAQSLPDFGARLDLHAQVLHAKRAYGALLRTLYEVHGHDAEKVLSMLMADKHSEKLVQAGVLTMSHA